MISGCGSNERLYPVQGNVISSDGIAPTFGLVEFRSMADGRIVSGNIQPDGSFTLTTQEPDDGAVAGEHEVVLVRFINAENGPIHTHGHAVEIPTRYASYDTSGLTATVKPGPTNKITVKFDRK